MSAPKPACYRVHAICLVAASAFALVFIGVFMQVGVWELNAAYFAAQFRPTTLSGLFLDTFGVGAYQLAVLTLLGTMLLGAWILRPVSDRWTGSGEVDVHAPPERLAPMTAPLEPRG